MNDAVKATDCIMSSYAVLGATGNTGQALINVLLQSPDKKIHAYCRSKLKLTGLCPGIEKSSQVQIFEGDLQVDLLVKCLHGTRAAFLVVASSENVPGCSIAQDTVKAVLPALEELKLNGERLPKIIVLSSASLEDVFMSGVPHFVHTMLYCAASYVYEDLRQAEKILRSRDDLTTTTFVRPGGLSHDTQKGHRLSFGPAKTPVSFLDLAAGMVEVADELSERYDMKGVTVNPTAQHVAFPREAPLALLRGLLFHFFPWTYKYLK